jgi:class 3 adenylate cyclase
MRLRDLLVAVAAGVVATAVTVLGAGDLLKGWSIDGLFWLRYQAYGPLHPASTSPSVVIAIDEETYRTPPFDGLPKALWTPQLATVLDKVVEAGAAVVGFDAVLSETVESVVPGYDRQFLVALHRASADGRVVLGKVQHQELPIAPSPAQSFAVGHERNIRAANLLVDPDEMIRRDPLTFRADDRRAGTRREPSFALELAARTAHAPIDWSGGAGVRLGGWTIPARDDGMLLNFDGGGGDIPTLPLADLFACASAGKLDYFRERFAGKAVLFGVVLDVEDRQATSRRFINGPDDAGRQPRCASEPLPAFGRPQRARDSVPGVLVHATAINNLLRRDPLRDLPPAADAAVAGGFGVVAATASAIAPLGPAGVALAIGMLLYGALATVALHGGLALPLLQPLVAVALAFVLVLVYRITVADKDKRRLRKMFALYLAPEMVDRMVASDRLPQLGGERREMSFLFTDVAGFTTMAERMDPTVLAPILNRYLDGACDVIMKHGGMVNEFIGDAILAFFGAPQDQPDHAARVVACARALDSFAEAFRQAQQDADIPFGKTRIGVHTGIVFVGNVGSHQHLKYSALGDVVNTASRLEGLNKFFGTRVIASGDTLARCDETRVRPLGRFVLKGRSQPIEVYELVEEPRCASAEIARYREAYRLLEAGDPKAAEAAFGALAAALPDDGCVALHLERLRAGARDSVVVMEEK